MREFEARPGAIDDLVVIAAKQVTDARGTVRELFRRSAFESVGIDVGRFEQVNLTESGRGTVRGLHAEQMTKLVAVASGRAFGAYLDLRHGSRTFGVVETVELRPGLQVLVPAGVANGFQALTDHCQYVYCFDAEWMPGMPGRSCNPLDPALAIPWPLPVDPDDPAQVSAKDRTAPSLAELRVAIEAGS